MSFDLRAERMNRGVTIAALAETTGLSRHTIMRIESDGALPTAPTAYAIAQWVGRPASELWPTPLPEPDREAAA